MSEKEKEQDEFVKFAKKWTKRGIIVAVIIILAWNGITAAFGTVAIVPSGYKGVLLTWGEATGVFDEGLHFITPYRDSVVLMDTTVHKTETNESAASYDLQEVTASLAVNYRINPAYILEIYKTLRQDWEYRVIAPNIEESIKATTANFTAENLIQERDFVKVQFLDILGKRLELYHIDVLSVSITNFEFSPSFTAAIEAKATAVQKALEEKNNLDIIFYQAQQKIIQAQADANASITWATGDAEAKRIQAETDAHIKVIMGQAEAQAIELLNAQLGNATAYIQWVAIRQWNGQLPYIWSDNILPIINWNFTRP